MKKLKYIFSFILLLSFLSSVLGVQVYKHYCGDFLAEVSLYFQSNPCADEGGEEACSKGKKESCCDDEFQYLQLDVDLQKTNIQRPNFDQLALKSIHPLVSKLIVDTPLNEDEALVFEHPPERNQLPLYRLFNRYTLYG